MRDIQHSDDRSVVIRAATPADAPGIAPLLDQLGYPSSADQIQRRLERLVDDEASEVLVAEIDNALVGLVAFHVTPLLEHDQPVGQLIALAVDQASRRLGIGRRLVDEIEREASARGCYGLILNSGSARTDAHAFYHALAFDETGRRFAKTLVR